MHAEADRWVYIRLIQHFVYIKQPELQNCRVGCLSFNTRKEKEGGKQQKGRAVFLFIIPTSYMKGSLAKFAPKLHFFGTALSSHINNTLLFQV